MHDDVVAVVLVEAHVGEELARAVVAERCVGEGVRRVRPLAVDPVAVHGDRARGHPRRADDHPLPAVLDRLDAADPAAVLLVDREAQVRLVVEAVAALDDRLLQLVVGVICLPGLGVDPQDALVVELDLQVLRPAAVAPQPRRRDARVRG